MRRVLLSTFICCLLAACNRTTGEAHAPSGAGAQAAGGATRAPAHPAKDSPDARSSSTGGDTATPVAGATADGDAAPPKDAFTLPGAINPDTGLADLRRIYGAANVGEGNLPGSGDEAVRGVILFPDDPRRRAYVYFQDPKKMTGLSMVAILDKGSTWRGVQGVRVGMPLSELVASNGKPFEFYGFEGLYGGWVDDWMDGRLAAVGDGMSLRVRLAHRVFPKDVPHGDLPYENFRSFRSDHPQLARMQVVVDEISLDMPGEDDR